MVKIHLIEDRVHLEGKTFEILIQKTPDFPDTRAVGSANWIRSNQTRSKPVVTIRRNRLSDSSERNSLSSKFRPARKA